MQLTTLLSDVHFLFAGGLRERYNLASLPLQRPSLAQLARMPRHRLPRMVRFSPLALRYLDLLGPISWDDFPARDTHRAWPGPAPHSPVPYLVALLMRLDQKHQSMGQLVAFLRHHPELLWLAGFPLTPDSDSPWGFDEVASTPSPAQFSQMLRHLPNAQIQFLLDETVRQLQVALPADADFGKTVSIDTKHVIAWAKENNPKAFIKEGRFDKERQPKGDRDCRLGCKRRSNQRRGSAPDTPKAKGQPAEGIGSGIGEFYWGYGSGIIAAKVPNWGEFVLAELTQTFDQSDISYFFPLMAEVERRLGFKPPFGTGDAAYDAHYIYQYFHEAGGMAAVPLVDRGPRFRRSFDEEGHLLCKAGLPMYLKGVFSHRTSLVPHRREQWWCPLLYPEPNGQTCPIQDAKWAKEGCKSTIAQSMGARIRHQLDRESDQYRSIYRQRTATERLFSRAVDLGIERPKLRNRRSIANINTLIYVLLNLRALAQVRERLASLVMR